MKVNSWSLLFVYAPSSLICPNLFPEFEKDWLPADSKNYAAQVMFSAAFFCSILVLVPRSQFWNQHHGNFVRINFPDRCRCGDFMFFFPTIDIQIPQVWGMESSIQYRRSQMRQRIICDLTFLWHCFVSKMHIPYIYLFYYIYSFRFFWTYSQRTGKSFTDVQLSRIPRKT